MNDGVTKDYVSKVSQRLREAGFHIDQNIKYDNQVFECTARRTKFLIERGGFFTTFFLFAVLDTQSISALKEFSTIAFRYSQKKGGIHLPRGLGYGFVCFPVAITQSVPNDLAIAIRQQGFPKHWSSFEKLVVFNIGSNELYYSEKTPAWGSLYHDLDRATINEMLAP